MPIGKTMAKGIFFCLFVGLFGVVWSVETPPQFRLDTAQPPEHRWDGAVKAVLDVHAWDTGFGPSFAAHNASLFSHLPAEAFDVMVLALETYFPVNAAELQGIARQFGELGYPVSYPYLAAWVYYHELAHTDAASPGYRAHASKECTGIVTRSPDGSVTHAGNMDQGPEAVRNVTLQVEFTHNDELVFSGVDWYWFTTGVTRAVRKGVASFQENWRTLGVQPLNDTLAHIAQGAVPQVFVFRAILTNNFSSIRCDEPAVNATPFTAAIACARQVPLAAPFYIVASGFGGDHDEGVIITRSTGAVDSEVWLGSNTTHPDFIVQTNYDQCVASNTPDVCHPLPDDQDDPRRTAAEVTLGKLGSQFSTDLGLFATLSSYPVHNPHTAYTAIMHADTGTLNAFVRAPMCPEANATSPMDQRYCNPW
eukprot:m.68748 g.68748  ORF g.68748 m.68748 type:complete len:422 (+) comp23988_c0_seq1:257-1522(+)